MISKPSHGHYLTTLARQANRPTYETLHQSIPEADGFMIRYDWKLLEPSPHRYDFTQLLSDLDWAAERGLKLMPMFEDKSFNDVSPVPEYLSKHVVPNRSGGSSAVRWNPIIAHEFRSLVSRAAHLSSHPAWEGVLLMETAPSLPEQLLTATEYSPELYAQTYIDLFKAADTRFFWQANFIPPRNENLIDAVMAAAQPGQVHVGGPDCLPNNKALLERPYPIWKKYPDNFVGMSLPTYSVENWSIEKVMRYGQTELNAKWFIWTYAADFAEQTQLIKLAH